MEDVKRLRIQSTEDTRTPETDSVKKMISTYLMTNSVIFRNLVAIREQGWANEQGDEHFKTQRKSADEASASKRKGFFGLMQRIGDELQTTTGVLRLPGSNPNILDICMAPGGYSAAALKHSPSAHVCGITLPATLGGHPMLIPYGIEDQRVEVEFADITMLAGEFGVAELPKEHPDLRHFSMERPWIGKPFDLVFCDGQVLRTQEVADYRQHREASRLACSQLILAMQRIKPGGTLVMLLHRVEMWQTIKLLSIFDKISKLQLFKPKRAHSTRSSFYLTAENVQPHCEEAVAAIEEWKAAWKEATFSLPQPNEKRDEEEVSNPHLLNGEAMDLIATYGERLIELGEPVWLIQKDALKEAPWFKRKDTSVADTTIGQD